MKSRSEIWLSVLNEFSTLCSVSTTHDVETVMRRVESEGDSFYKVTLPLYGKEFERTLALRCIPTTAYKGYGRQGVKYFYTSHSSPTVMSKIVSGGPPKFLGGFQDLIFSVPSVHIERLEDGSFCPPEAWNNSACWPQVRMIEAGIDPKGFERMVHAVAAIRQLTLMFAKEKELAPVPAQEAAIRSYVTTDKELDNPLLDDQISRILFEGGRLERLRKVITLVFGQALSDVDREVYAGELKPGHGSGSTSDRLFGNQKWVFDKWTSRMESVFPYGVYTLPNARFDAEDLQIELLEPEEELPTKVTLIPKTMTTPRIIAAEPTCMQYMQQALHRSLVPKIENDNLARWFTSFTDQRPNQAMAQIGSDDGSLATLDLSDASDRVANWLVEDLFGNWPSFLEGLQASRSTSARLPSGEVIPLLKFASMGSAMTFPIEAMVFTAIVLERVCHAKGLTLSIRSLKTLIDTVRVYGDDIIVPNDTAESVIEGLELCNLKVNRHKSFWTGEFRESCGKEYWRGEDVSIVRFRTRLPSSLKNATEVVSTVSTRNQLFKAGLKMTAELLDSDLERVLHGHYPVVAETSSVLGRLDDLITYSVDDWDEELHAPLVRGYAVKPRIPYSEIDGSAALLKCLLTTIGIANVDEDHLTRSGRPRAVSLKLVMGLPF